MRVKLVEDVKKIFNHSFVNIHAFGCGLYILGAKGD